MPPPLLGAAGGVAELLNSAQDSAASCERCAGALWKALLAEPDAAFEDLTACVDHLLTISEKSPHVDRCVRLFGLFAAKAPAGGPDEVVLAVLEELLSHLRTRLSATDKGVRLRAAQLLQQLLGGLPSGLLLDAAVLSELAAALVQRLQDKHIAVRAEATRAVCHLITDDATDEEEEEDDDLTEAVLALLASDRSKDVRIAVVQALPLSPATLPAVLRRAHDVSPLVRKALVGRLRSVSLKVLSIEQRAAVILQLLRDRDAGVADAAAKLLNHWLAQECAGDPLQLLQLLDVETYPDAAVCAVESLVNTDSIQPPAGQHISNAAASSATAYIRAAAAAPAAGSGVGLPGLRQLAAAAAAGGRGKVQLLQPHQALMWRVMCEWLRTDAISKGLAAAATGGARAAVQAAVAAERHEVLEQALPESAEALMQLVIAHAEAGPDARFATAQLLLIAATCMEWTDVASREAAAPYLQQLLALDPTAEAAAAAAGDGMQLAGAGGDGAFEGAVAALLLAVESSPAGFSCAMLDGLASLAAAAGLLGKPGFSGDAAGESARFSVGGADSSQLLQLLAYARLLLQQLPCRRGDSSTSSATSCCGSISMASLWELLLALALKQDHPLVRAKALECIGLYALAHHHAPSSPAALLASTISLLGPLAAAGGAAVVRSAAVKALTDIALCCGPAAVDSVLRRPDAAGAAEGQEEQDEEEAAAAGAAGAWLRGGSKGLLQLLIDTAEGLLAEAQAAAAAPAAKGGRGRKGRAAATDADDSGGLPAASAELFAAVAESLAKLLLHQRAWLRQYAPYASALEHGDDVGDVAASGRLPARLPPDSQQQQARLLQRALALLLQLQFHVATESSSQLCQCLSVFFDVFATAADGNRLQLAAACLPAARQSLHVTAKRAPAPLLVKYVLQLLASAAQPAAQGEGEAGRSGGAAAAEETLLGESFGSVAQLLLAEVALVAPITVGVGQQPGKFRPYLSALLKVVGELPLDAQHCSHEQRASLQSMLHSLSATIGDASLAKDVAAAAGHVQAMADAAGQPQQQLEQAAVEELMSRVCRLSLSTLPALPGALGEAAAAAAAGGAAAAAAARPRGAAGRKTAAAAAPARVAGKGRASAARASSDSSDDATDEGSDSEADDASSDEEEAGQQQQQRRVSAAGRSGRAVDADGSEADSELQDSSSDDDEDEFLSADELQEQSPAAAGGRAGKGAAGSGGKHQSGGKPASADRRRLPLGASSAANV